MLVHAENQQPLLVPYILQVFINVCSSSRVAAPGGWQGGVMPDEVAAALDKMQVGVSGSRVGGIGGFGRIPQTLRCRGEKRP